MFHATTKQLKTIVTKYYFKGKVKLKQTYCIVILINVK
jgi:hypothetical protein